MQTLKIIPVIRIFSIKNYRDVNPPTAEDQDVIELADSLKKHGVMQPVLVRPTKDPNDYELIFGHRRLLACEVAGILEIPANVKEVPDEDILELQVTENLQRKDVHPMDEAVAFKHLMEAKKLTVEEVAARFAKKPEYIMQRLSFNNLIPELQKLFKQNKMLTGHAVLLSRLSAADQVEVKKENYYESNGGFDTVADLSDFIERSVTRNLFKTAFKLDDATIHPVAGACTACPKRSGYNRLLFPDISAKDDRCFDKACYEIKAAAGFQLKLREIIETRPDVHIVSSRYGQDPSKPILATVKELKLKVLEEDKDFDDGNWGRWKTKAKGFYINGHKSGSIETIYLAGPAVAGKDGKPAEEDPAEQIKKINDREKRAKELDLEKVHAATLTAMKDNKDLDKPGFPFQPIDSAFFIYLLLHETAGFQALKTIQKHLKWLPKEPGYGDHGYQFDYIKKLGICSKDDIAFIIRTIAMDKYGSVNVQGIRKQDTILRMIAEYIGIDLKSIETAQQVIADKRQARVAQRVALLKTQIKEKSAKKVVKKPTLKTAVADSKGSKKKS